MFDRIRPIQVILNKFNLGIIGESWNSVFGVFDVSRQQRQDVERLLGERRHRLCKRCFFD